jgi:hypothetical protein
LRFRPVLRSGRDVPVALPAARRALAAAEAATARREEEFSELLCNAGGDAEGDEEVARAREAHLKAYEAEERARLAVSRLE